MGLSKTPTAKLANRGSWRAKVRKNEPVYDTDIDPTPPDGLDVNGEAIWNRIFPMISNQGVLTCADLAALERYCRYWQEWKAMTAAGCLHEMVKLEGVMLKLEQQFGLTPASRPNIKSNKQENMDGKRNYFKVV